VLPDFPVQFLLDTVYTRTFGCFSVNASKINMYDSLQPKQTTQTFPRSNVTQHNIVSFCCIQELLSFIKIITRVKYRTEIVDICTYSYGKYVMCSHNKSNYCRYNCGTDYSKWSKCCIMNWGLQN